MKLSEIIRCHGGGLFSYKSGLVQVWTGESEDLVVGSVGLMWGGVREPVGEMQMKLDWVLSLVKLGGSHYHDFKKRVRLSSQ